MSTPQPGSDRSETPMPDPGLDSRELLRLAVEIDISVRQQQSESLKSLRDRSLHLLEIITVAESILFAVGFRDNRDMDARVVFFLIILLTSSLAVTCYIARPAANWATALETPKLVNAATKGIGFSACLQELLAESKGREENEREIARRQNLFKWYLIGLTASMLIVTVIITGELLKK